MYILLVSNCKQCVFAEGLLSDKMISNEYLYTKSPKVQLALNLSVTYARCVCFLFSFSDFQFGFP